VKKRKISYIFKSNAEHTVQLRTTTLDWRQIKDGVVRFLLWFRQDRMEVSSSHHSKDGAASLARLGEVSTIVAWHGMVDALSYGISAPDKRYSL